MPDDWELAMGLAPFTDDADEDADGDGLSNLQEYFAGTNPLDASSHVRIDAANAAGQIRLTFQAMAGRSYSIEYLDGLGAGQWNRLTNVAPQVADYLAEVPDTLPQGATGRFYRLVTPRLP